MFRYFSLVWDQDNTDQAHSAALLSTRLKEISPQWRETIDCNGLRVFVADASASGLSYHLLGKHDGVVVGRVFERPTNFENCDVACPPASFDEDEAALILASNGRRLTTGYWGNYVAFLAAPDAGITRVLKDPVGTLPCYTTSYRGVHIFFSCFADCLDLRLLRFTVNWTYVVARVTHSILDAQHNSFKEVSQVYRGECVEIALKSSASGIKRHMYWNPMTFSESNDVIENPEYAAQTLRATIRACTRSWASLHRTVLQQVSGGLDSSIVLACLGSSPAPEIICYTYFIPGAPSDERRWARLAVGNTGRVHLERAIYPGAIPYAGMPDMSASIEPIAIMDQMLKGPFERHLAEQFSATAIFTGEGGDSGFCSDSYSLAVDSYIGRHGFDLNVFRLASRVAIKRDTTLWKVIARSIRRRFAGSSMRDHWRVLSQAFQLVSTDFRNSLMQQEHYPHPWFSSCDDVPWSTIYRLGTIVFAPQFYDLSTKQSSYAPLQVSPLCSQPVIELVLRIPTYLHFLEGRDRGLARQAFAGDIPQAINRRQWKDRAPGSASELLNCNLEFVREALLDSPLVKEGLLDRRLLEQSLSSGPTTASALGGEIFDHLDTALWLRKSLAYASHPTLAHTARDYE